MERKRAVLKQGQGQEEKVAGEIGIQSLKDQRIVPMKTGIWKYAANRGINPDLLVLARRYVNFGIVGASGIGVDMAALFVLADPHMLHLNLSLGKALAAEIAILSNFIWNELWTFRDFAIADLTWRGRATRLGKFNLICLAGILLSVFLLNLQTRLFSVNMYVGNLIAIGIVSIWNFGMNQKFGWKIERTRNRYVVK
jgi:putative flippase GtrA